MVPVEDVRSLGRIFAPCQHAVDLANALNLGHLLEPNPGGCDLLGQIAAAAAPSLAVTVAEDGAAIVQLPGTRSAMAVRCPSESGFDWAVVQLASSSDSYR